MSLEKNEKFALIMVLVVVVFMMFTYISTRIIYEVDHLEQIEEACREGCLDELGQMAVGYSFMNFTSEYCLCDYSRISIKRITKLE